MYSLTKRLSIFSNHPGPIKSLQMPVEIPQFVQEWFTRLDSRSLSNVVPGPDCAAIVSVDMVVGFCQAGSLASERLGALIPPMVHLFHHAYQHGIRHFVLLQDAHAPNTPEFQAYPPHCIRDTHETETVDGLRQLPFAHEFVTFQKNSLSPGIETGFEAWLRQRPYLQTAVVVGNCTDLCVSQVAMYLRLRANALNLDAFRVIVPAETVDTYDLPTHVAHERQIYPHPGDFFHHVLLDHLALNGIEVYGKLT